MEVASQSPVRPVLGLGMGSTGCIWDLLVEVLGACSCPFVRAACVPGSRGYTGLSHCLLTDLSLGTVLSWHLISERSS